MTESRRRKALVQMEQSLINLCIGAKNLETQAEKMRIILEEFDNTLRLIAIDAKRMGYSDGWHDAYFDGYNEGFAEGVGEE